MFSNVFNGKGGFNGKFLAMSRDIQAGSFLFIEVSGFQLHKSGVVLLNSNYFLIETHSRQMFLQMFSTVMVVSTVNFLLCYVVFRQAVFCLFIETANFQLR